jgi:hypothetical protein
MVRILQLSLPPTRWEQKTAIVKAAARLVPVMVTPERDAGARQPSTALETIEIDLGAYRVRVGNAVDAQALRRVLDVLERR